MPRPVAVLFAMFLTVYEKDYLIGTEPARVLLDVLFLINPM